MINKLWSPFSLFCCNIAWLCYIFAYFFFDYICADRYKSDSFHNVNGWYFFTYLTNKYPKGSRPSRSCGDGGFWKPTGKDKKIYYNGNTVGYRKSLDFLLGPGQKTAWKMHEYRIHANNPKVQASTYFLINLLYILFIYFKVFL